MRVTVSPIRPLRPSLFISDLHLSDSDPHGIEWFVTFTKWIDKSVCEELFILGDLFDYWVGPKQMKVAGYQPVFQAIAAVVKRGIRVTVLRGNRDFYLEETFERETGANLGEDFVLLEANGNKIVLTHGDLLCSKDLSYQRFRKFIRSKPMYWIGLHLPRAVSMFFARGLRRYSQRVVPQKYPEEKSIVSDTVKQYLEQFDAKVLVCGHVHERREETLQLSRGPGKLFVLPAFEMNQPPLVYRDELRFAEKTSS